MRTQQIYMPELFLIGATRGMIGAGLGLLVSGRISKDQRRIAGATLLAIGALSTIPLAIRIFRRRSADLGTREQRSRDDRPSMMH